MRDTKKNVRKSLTFVFVTPRNWDKPKSKLPDFLHEYKNKKDFADVWYIDGAMLETWLEEHGAVGAKHARLVLGTVPNRGARSTDEFWREFSNRYSPQLTEAVALCARTEQANQIVSHLMSTRGPLVFVGDGPDEVSAVAVAAIRTAEDTSREYLEARTLIVDSDEAGRLLSRAGRYSYILSPNVKEVGESLATFGPTVSTLDYRPTGNQFARLERPSTRDMSEALQTMGLVEEKAESLARKSGRSLTILHRHAHTAGYSPPPWVKDGDRLIPALLAGAWSTQQAGDLEILAELSGVGYDDFEQGMRSYLSLQDTPIDLRAGIWRLRAPVDAFVNLSHLFARRHLDALAKVALKVFSTDTPPDIGEERFGVSNAPYSSLLRDGIATSLLIIAAMHEEVGLEIGTDPEIFVNDLVSELPGLREDIRVILGLEGQLTYLMEAAPRPLLSALELLLEGDATAEILFAETSSYGVPRTRLPNLMWALELQAWDPAYLRRVSLLLAKLASKDPGGRSGNRPISSLRDIFVAWLPGTNAPLAERLAVIDEIAGADPRVGWELITALLPKLHDTKGPTQRPRYREAGASDRERLTRGLVADTYNALADRALAMIGQDVGHWVAIVDAFPRFSPERRVQFLEMLTPRAAQAEGEDRNELRRALRRLADRHSRFREAEWALSEPELARLKRIVKSLDSDDPFDQARALFDEWMPYGAEDYVAAEKAIRQRRSNVLSSLAATSGAAALIRLADVVRMPRLVAYAAASGVHDESVLEEILNDGSADGPAPDFSASLAGSLRSIRGETLDDTMLALADRFGWTPVRTASMLLHWPEERRTWELVESLGEEAVAHFWMHREPRRFEGPVDDLDALVRYYLVAGRASNALPAIHPRENELSWPTVAMLLGGLVAEINRSGMHNDMDGFYVGELFKSLRQRDDVEKLDLARWEYAYFPVLEYQDGDLALFDRMAADPEFFVSILKDVYVADDADPGERESSEEERVRGTISHRILIANEKVPGEKDGVIDEDALNAWVDGMLAEARKAKRTKVVPSYIGRVLAHADPVDAVWPPSPVARTIERLKSDDVEQAIMIERFNMRGVYSKPMFEGGVQERELAQRYREWAQANASFPRTKTMLTTIAKRWEADAKREDDQAERDKLRFE